MSRNLVVTEGYEVDITEQGVHTAGDYTNFPKTSENFSKIKAVNKKLLKPPILSWTAIGCTLSGYVFVSGVGSIKPDAKTKIPTAGIVRDKCFREGAKGNCMGIFTTTTTPPTIYPCVCKIEISKAGQDKVKSE